MDTIVNSALELIFYLIERFTYKEEKEKKIDFGFKLYEKSGILIIARKNKPPLYTIKLPEYDTFIENLEFESTTDIGVGVDMNVIGRKDKEEIFYIEPVEIYSQNFFNDILEFLNKRKVKK